eukprot:10900750-Heterocapsa_arctica.AAC.1
MSVHIGKLEGQKDLWYHTLRSCARLKFSREKIQSLHRASGTAQMEENFTWDKAKIVKGKQPARVARQESASTENMPMVIAHSELS